MKKTFIKAVEIIALVVSIILMICSHFIQVLVNFNSDFYWFNIRMRDISFLIDLTLYASIFLIVLTVLFLTLDALLD